MWWRALEKTPTLLLALLVAQLLSAGVSIQGALASQPSRPSDKREVAQSRLQLGLSMPSATLKRSIPYAIYQPRIAIKLGPALKKSSAKLPVLYLLHGHGDNENAWARYGHIKTTLDELIATRQIKPLIVVMPMAGNSWYVDDARQKGFGAIAKALTGDLVHGIDKRYPSDACRQRRAIGGLSMGGFGAVLYAFKNQDKYSAAISLSGSLFPPGLASSRRRKRRMSHLFGGVYGEPFDIARFNAWNVFPLVTRAMGAVANGHSANHPPEQGLPAVWLAAGDKDFPAILRGTVRLHQKLRRGGAISQLRIDDAGHTWSYWRKAIRPALKWLSPHLATSCQ